jgi:uncharacterized protein YjiS (DUF1127 family)
MSYNNYAHYRTQNRINVPFAEFVAPFAFVGEAVYTAANAGARVVGKAFRAAMAKVRERAAVATLSNLDDRILKDIGVRRSEIHFLARRVAENPGVDYRVLCR